MLPFAKAKLARLKKSGAKGTHVFRVKGSLIQVAILPGIDRIEIEGAASEQVSFQYLDTTSAVGQNYTGRLITYDLINEAGAVSHVLNASQDLFGGGPATGWYYVMPERFAGALLYWYVDANLLLPLIGYRGLPAGANYIPAGGNPIVTPSAGYYLMETGSLVSDHFQFNDWIDNQVTFNPTVGINVDRSRKPLNTYLRANNRYRTAMIGAPTGNPFTYPLDSWWMYKRADQVNVLSGNDETMDVIPHQHLKRFTAGDASSGFLIYKRLATANSGWDFGNEDWSVPANQGRDDGFYLIGRYMDITFDPDKMTQVAIFKIDWVSKIMTQVVTIATPDDTVFVFDELLESSDKYGYVLGQDFKTGELRTELKFRIGTTLAGAPEVFTFDPQVHLNVSPPDSFPGAEGVYYCSAFWQIDEDNFGFVGNSDYGTENLPRSVIGRWDGTARTIIKYTSATNKRIEVRAIQGRWIAYQERTIQAGNDPFGPIMALDVLTGTEVDMTQNIVQNGVPITVPAIANQAMYATPVFGETLDGTV